MLDQIEHDHILELRLNRPPVNALDPALVVALRDAIVAAPASGYRAILLSGRPGMFSAGLDVAHLLTLDESAIGQFWVDFFGLMRAIAVSEIPIAAAITGHSPAGGAVLAVFCDKRFMADGKYLIGFNEVRVGLPVPPPVRYAFERLAPAQRVERMLVEGLLVTAAYAADLGLVDELRPDDDVVDAALDWCREITGLPPVAMHATRQVARSGFAQAFDDNPIPPPQMNRTWFSDETQQAMRAMLESLAKKKAR